MNLAIYGAQGMALGAYEAIHCLYPMRKQLCFLVTEMGENAPTLAGIPVLEAASFARGLSQEEKENVEILIATPENMMGEIEESLDRYGLCCHVRLNSQRWAKLMGGYYLRGGEYMPLSALPVGYRRAGIRVYMARFGGDRILQGEYFIPDWVAPIQVGAALCRERVAGLLDCEGENISEKNGNYSELTGLYWIWKNMLCKKAEELDCQYYGLAHYRRMLILDEDDLLRLAGNGVDVVLPYPMPYEPDIEMHHKRYLADKDWATLLRALEELQPEYAGAFPRILRQRYLYNYNIMLARSRILADYCEWLFPILERVEQLSIPKGSERADRYIGYMGESLATLYFRYNHDRLNIAHAGCRFMV